MSIKYIANRKIYNKLSVSALLIALVLTFACSTGTKENILNKKINNHKDYFIIWAHSDIQPRNKSERSYYETAISDINENFSEVKIALVAGDIIHWSNSPKVFEWYNWMKKKTQIKYWYEIAGNHDQKDYKNYKKYINLPLHYSVQVGNLLILCLSAFPLITNETNVYLMKI